MSEKNKSVSYMRLDELAQIDPESLSEATSPRFRFKYIDISCASNGKLSLPSDSIEFSSAPSRARKIVKDGDVIVSTVRPNLKAFAYCRLDEGPYIASTGFSVLRAKDSADAYFLLTTLLGNDLAKQIESYAVGSNYPAINSSDVRRLKMPAFSIEIQRKIGRLFRFIDRAIEHTEALIDKYQQIKAGLMHDLFTRGIGPNGQLRPPRDQAPELYQQTPIGWIPKEWELRNLGAMAKIVSGVTLGSKESPSDTIEAPYLRVANVQDGYLDLSEIKTVKISRKVLEYLRLLPGDVLMNEGGDYDKLGRGAVWAGEIEDCVHQNHVFRVRTDFTVLNSLYLAYYSESAFGKRYFLLSSKQSTNLASINSKQLNAYPIALPLKEEQDEIIRRIGGAKLQIDSLKAESEKLQKQKSGLMHDLLTGEVPVTVDAAAPEAAHD
jgi:type I restriction enzyme S subunit